MSDDFDLIDDATQMAIGDEFVIVRPRTLNRGVVYEVWYPNGSEAAERGDPDVVCVVTEFRAQGDGFYGKVMLYSREEENIQHFTNDPNKYNRGDRYKRFNRNKSYELDQKLDESEDLL